MRSCRTPLSSCNSGFRWIPHWWKPSCVEPDHVPLSTPLGLGTSRSAGSRYRSSRQATADPPLFLMEGSYTGGTPAAGWSMEHPKIMWDDLGVPPWIGILSILKRLGNAQLISAPGVDHALHSVSKGYNHPKASQNTCDRLPANSPDTPVQTKMWTKTQNHRPVLLFTYERLESKRPQLVSSFSDPVLLKQIGALSESGLANGFAMAHEHSYASPALLLRNETHTNRNWQVANIL